MNTPNCTPYPVVRNLGTHICNTADSLSLIPLFPVFREQFFHTQKKFCDLEGEIKKKYRNFNTSNKKKNNLFPVQISPGLDLYSLTLCTHMHDLYSLNVQSA